MRRLLNIFSIVNTLEYLSDRKSKEKNDMKRTATILLVLPLLLSGCTGDDITVVEQEKTGVSVDCSELNSDIAALQSLSNECIAGSMVTSVSDGTISFSSGQKTTVITRSAYSFDYANPTIGVGSAQWLIDGTDISSDFTSELLRIKGENGYWYAYYGGEWNKLYDIFEGISIPVFSSLSDDADSVYITLSDGIRINIPKYSGVNYVTLSESLVKPPVDGGEYSLTVTAGDEWTAVISESWIGLSDEYGEQGETQVTVTVEPNEDTARSGYVTFTSGDVCAILTVNQDGESGGGIIENSDTEESEDNVSYTEFDRTIYITYSASGATVKGDVDGITAVTGNDVTVNNTTDEKIIYYLSGTAQDGFFKVYSSKKQAIIMDGLSLTNRNGAAINNQGKKRCFVVVKGNNTIADGSSYTDTPSSEDEKAAFFSEGQLIFSGDGTLTITAIGKAGITSDDYVRFMSSPTVKVTSSAGHGIRGKDAVIVSNGIISTDVSANMKKGITSDSLVCIDGGSTTIKVTGSAAYDSDDAEYTGTAGIKADQRFEINGGTLTITNSGTGGKGISGDAVGYFNGGNVRVTTTGSNYGSSQGGRNGSSSNSVSAKGIKFDGNLYFNGGTVTVSCKAHEGIESKGTITVTDGVVYSYSSADDAINAASTFTIEGGMVCGYATSNDGLDANGNFYIKEGLVYAIGSGSPELAVDANTEYGYKLYLQGGTLIAIGGLESGASLTQSCYQASAWNKSTWYSMTVGSTVIAFKTPASGGTPLVVSGESTPTLKSGITVSGGTSWFEGILTAGGSVSGGSSVSLSSYTGGNGGGGNPGGPGGGGRKW